MRSPVFVSKRVPYTTYLPSGDNVGRKPEPKRVVICDTRPVSLSQTWIWNCAPMLLYCQSPVRAANHM